MQKKVDFLESLGQTRTPDLSRRRALHPDTLKPMPHAQSRHLQQDQPLFDQDGNAFSQGNGIFPKFVKPGDLTLIEKEMLKEFRHYRKGQDSKIVEAKPAGGSTRIRMRLDKYGVDEIGGFISHNQVHTVFPEDKELNNNK